MPPVVGSVESASTKKTPSQKSQVVIVLKVVEVVVAVSSLVAVDMVPGVVE